MSVARDYLQAHGINLQVAFDVGVRANPAKTELVYPTGKRAILNGERTKFLAPKGTAEAWWVQRADHGWALVCEGESDGLAAVSALRFLPASMSASLKRQLSTLPVLAVPGTGYPVERLAADVCNFRSVFLCFDGDEAGVRYANEVWDTLTRNDMRPIQIPAEPDLAGWLSSLPETERGERLASLLIDSELSAPTLDELRRERQAEWHEAEARRLREAV